MPMPLKMSGSAISTIEELIVAISMPSVVLDSAIHLYRGPSSAIEYVRRSATVQPFCSQSPLARLSNLLAYGNQVPESPGRA